jgi:putative ABC transport system permease protein
MDVIVSIFDLGGQLEQRTASCVFGTLADARRDFGADQTYVFAANLDTTADVAHGITKEQLVDRIQKAVGVWGLKVGDVRKIKHDILSGFQTLLLLCSTIAFAAMGVASLGVTNTIMAAVRSRRWQFGVLRGIGLTRGQLLRLVLAEAVLLAITGCAMGLAAGLELAIDAKAFTVSTLGYNPPMVIPWGMLGIGAGIVIALALLAALWPAVTTAASQPLTLLQAGRASG